MFIQAMLPPFSTQPFTHQPLLAVAGRKEDEVNQGAILRAFLPWGFFYFHIVRLLNKYAYLLDNKKEGKK